MAPVVTTTNTLDCQLSFHQRVHAQAVAKTVTVGKEAEHDKHLLMPLGGVSGQQSDHQQLIQAIATHPQKIPVADTLNERDFFAAARSYVQANLPGYDVLDVVGIPSFFNPQTHRWDPMPQSATAYGYVIVDAATGDPVETFYSAGTETLWIDFVIHLQRNAP
jgi:hypothetical protein